MKLHTCRIMIFMLLICTLFVFSALTSCSEKEYQFPEVTVPPEYFTNSSYNLENLVDTDVIKNDIETICELEDGGRAVYVHIKEKSGVRYYTLDSYYIVVDKNGKCISDIRYTSVHRDYHGDALLCMLDLNDESTDKYDYNTYYENLIVDVRAVTDGSLLNTFTNSRIFHEMDDYSIIYLYMGNGIYKQGVLDKNFNLILEPVYDDIMYYSDVQKFAFFKDDKWVFGDEKGKPLSSQTYERVTGYDVFRDRSPLISVYRDGKYGFVNGDTLDEEIPLIYDLTGHFSFLENHAYVVLGDEIFVIDEYGNRIKDGMFPDCEGEEKAIRYVSGLQYVAITHPTEAVISKDDFYFHLSGYMSYTDNLVTLDIMQTYLSYQTGNDREYYTAEKIEETGVYDYYKDIGRYSIYPYQDRMVHEAEHTITDVSRIGENIYEVRAVPFINEKDISTEDNEGRVSYLIGAGGEKYATEEYISMRDYRYDEEIAAVLESECRENTDKYRIYTFTVRITDGGFMYLDDAVMS